MCSPSGDVLGVFAVSGTVGIADLENCADRATVFSGRALHTDQVLPTVVRMSVPAERSHRS